MAQLLERSKACSLHCFVQRLIQNVTWQRNRGVTLSGHFAVGGLQNTTPEVLVLEYVPLHRSARIMMILITMILIQLEFRALPQKLFRPVKASGRQTLTTSFWNGGTITNSGIGIIHYIYLATAQTILVDAMLTQAKGPSKW